MHNTHILLHLSLIDGVGSATIAAVLHNSPLTFDLIDIYAMPAEQLSQQFGLTLTMAQKITLGLQDTKLLMQELALIEKYQIQWATILCPAYPAALKTIHLMPPVMYWQGAQIMDDVPAVAIVGSRKANRYGDYVINHLVPTLVAHNYTIVSGGALGADSIAHRATLQAGGRTVVVLGSGLLQPYPLSNVTLFKDIIANGGTIVSAFPLLMEALPGNFPARNRIISGLSKGSIVVQAAARSGALITARYAMDQGRDVFAVPGPIDDELSAGCHKLLSQGARLVTSAYDVLEEFGHEVERPEVNKPEKPKAKQRTMQATSDKSQVKPAAITQLTIATVIKPPVFDGTPQGRVMAACQQPASLDDLCQTTGFDMGALNGLLFDLQLEGKVTQNFMGMWQLI